MLNFEKTFRKIYKECINRIINEGIVYDEDEEMSPFEEYENDYPNDDFDVSSMTPDKLALWCKKYAGDFLYVGEGIRGLCVMVASSSEIIDDIVDIIRNCSSIEPTHKVDYLLRSRQDEFENDYVCVFKVNSAVGGKLYIVYQQDKFGRYNTV